MTPRRVRLLLSGILATVAAVLVIAVPLFALLIAYNELTGHLAGDADQVSREVTRLINADPQMWRFHEHEVAGALGREAIQFPRHAGEYRRLIDTQGRTIQDLSAEVAWPSVARRSQFFDSGVPLGHVEIRASLIPVLQLTGAATLVAVGMGALLFIGLRRVTLRTVDQALERAAAAAREAAEAGDKRAAMESRMVTMLEQQSRMDRLMETLASTANRARDTAEAMNQSLRQLCDYSGWQLGHAVLIERYEDHVRAAANFWYAQDIARYAEFVALTQDYHYSLKQGAFVTRMLQTRQPVWIGDLSGTSKFGRLQGLTRVGLTSGLVVPVIGGENEVNGFLEFFSDQAKEPDPDTLAAVQRAGEQIGRVVDRAAAEDHIRRLNVELEQRVIERTAELEASNRLLEERAREVGLAGQMISLMQTCSGVQDAAAVVERFCAQLFPEGHGGVYLIRESANFLERLAAWGEGPSRVNFATDECWALRRGQPHFARTRGKDLFCGHVDAEVQAHDCLPMTAHGRAIGLLCLAEPPQAEESGTGARPAWGTRQLALMASEQLALALANLKLQESLREQSIRDSLTGLFNRRYLEETLERELMRARRAATGLAVLMLDVDHFKLFNDRHGHEAGDAVLKAMGHLLQEISRGSDIVCRYGGEEFTVVLPDTSFGRAREYGERLMQRVRGIEIKPAGVAIGSITISIGLALYPDHGEEIEPLVRAADAALYRAKDLGRDRLEVAEGTRLRDAATGLRVAPRRLN